jgi:hypothetical protein
VVKFQVFQFLHKCISGVPNSRAFGVEFGEKVYFDVGNHPRISSRIVADGSEVVFSTTMSDDLRAIWPLKSGMFHFWRGLQHNGGEL